MKRGEIRWYRFDQPKKRRPVLILTREALLPVLSEVIVAPATSVIRSIPGEVRLSEEEGMPRACVLNLFHVAAVPQGRIGAWITNLRDDRWPEVRRALLFALGFEP